MLGGPCFAQRLDTVHALRSQGCKGRRRGQAPSLRPLGVHANKKKPPSRSPVTPADATRRRSSRSSIGPPKETCEAPSPTVLDLSEDASQEGSDRATRKRSLHRSRDSSAPDLEMVVQESGSSRAMTAPCWHNLQDHVEGDYVVSHSLAFDTFLPSLVATASADVADPAPQAAADVVTAGEAAAPAAVVAPRALALIAPVGAGGQAGEREVGGIQDTRSCSDGAGSEGESGAKEPKSELGQAEDEGRWKIPFCGRWPEVWAVTPSSAPAPFCAPTAPRKASISSSKPTAEASSGSDLEKSNVVDATVQDGNALDPEVGPDGIEKVKVKRHRVLISGRNFAHPIVESRSSRAPSSPIRHGNPRKAIMQREGGDNTSVLGGSSTCGGDGAEGSDGHSGGAGSIPARDAMVGEDIDLAGDVADVTAAAKVEGGEGHVDETATAREVFVRFGRHAVPGKLLSDTLVEAYTPERPDPGFTDVVVVVKGGPGGDLASDAGRSGTGVSNRCVSSMYCAGAVMYGNASGVRGCRMLEQCWDVGR